MDDEEIAFKQEESGGDTERDLSLHHALLPEYDISSIIVDTNDYKYEDLDSETSQVRLIEILPAQEDGTVRCRTTSSYLDEQPKYIALSYAWGLPPSQHKIELDGKEFLVRKNLWRFLLHARRHRTLKGERFWVDAICIDQTNLRERTHQVSLMPMIYKGAYQVLAWLGPAYANSDRAMDLASTFESPAKRAPRTYRAWSHNIPQAVSEICIRSYWTRLWIFQELCLSRQTKLMCGGKIVDLQAFEVLLSTLSDSTWRPRKSDHPAYEIAAKSPAVDIVSQIQQEAETRSLLDLMIATRKLSCSETRDKVYALLGVAAGGSTNLVADYSLSLQALASHVLREQFRAQPPNSLSEVERHLSELADCFEVDLATIIKRDENYPRDILFPSDTDLFTVPTAYRREADIFLWAVYYNHTEIWGVIKACYEVLSWSRHAFSGAVSQGNRGIVQFFLDVDKQFSVLSDDWKGSAFFDALRFGHSLVAKTILYSGQLDVKDLGFAGFSALHAACELGCYPIVEALLVCRSTAVESGTEHAAIIPHSVNRRSPSQIAEKSSKTDRADINARDSRGRPPLYYASEMGFTEIVRYLLSHDDIDVNIQAFDGWTALHRASYKGRTEVVHAILASGKADTNVELDNGETVLHLACRQKRLDVVQCLMNDGNINVNVFDTDGYSPLLLAIDRSEEMLKTILQHSSVDINMSTSLRITPLIHACIVGHLAAVKVLLTKDEIDINFRASTGDTALHAAVCCGHFEVVKALLSDPRTKANTQGSGSITALSAASYLGNVEAVKALLQRGVDINIRCEDGSTALQMAVRQGHAEVAQILLATGKAHVNVVDTEGMTAFDIACQRGDLKAVQALLRCPGIDIHRRHKTGKTAMKLALENGHWDVYHLICKETKRWRKTSS